MNNVANNLYKLSDNATGRLLTTLNTKLVCTEDRLNNHKYKAGTTINQHKVGTFV
jgi:hypothetical protein